MGRARRGSTSDSARREDGAREREKERKRKRWLGLWVDVLCVGRESLGS